MRELTFNPRQVVSELDADPIEPLIVGEFFMTKFQAMLAETSPAHVAKRLKKDGVPLNIALLIIFGRF